MYSSMRITQRLKSNRPALMNRHYLRRHHGSILTQLLTHALIDQRKKSINFLMMITGPIRKTEQRTYNMHVPSVLVDNRPGTGISMLML